MNLIASILRKSLKVISVMALGFFLTIGNNTVEAQLVSASFLKYIPTENMPSIPGVNKEYDVKTYRLIYLSPGIDGDTVKASGLIAVPVPTSCDSFPMAVYCHGTILEQYDVPSYGSGEALIATLFASSGFITIAPDYLGLGIGKGIHPYLHAETEASASIDLIRAARDFIEESQEANANGQTFVTGYSQGGHAAMATLKYAQDLGLLDTLGIVAGAPCSGPYNITEYQMKPMILYDAPYRYMGYAVYIIMSYEAAYNNLYDSLNTVFKQQYIDDIKLYFDGSQDEYSMGVASDALPPYIKNLLTTEFYNAIKHNPDHPMWIDVADNDLYDWKPQFPLRMFYCDGDSQVNYKNSTTTADTMTANGAENVKAINVFPGADHSPCSFPALKSALNFFKSLADTCTTVAVQDAQLFSVYLSPNPAFDRLTVLSSEKIAHITVYNLAGHKIDITSPIYRGNKATLSLSALPPGINFIHIVTADGSKIVRKLAKV